MHRAGNLWWATRREWVQRFVLAFFGGVLVGTGLALIIIAQFII